MTRYFKTECSNCGHVAGEHKHVVPFGFRIIEGRDEDNPLCADCAASAERDCKHEEEKHMSTGTMVVQCQRCGRQRYLSMM